MLDVVAVTVDPPIATNASTVPILQTIACRALFAFVGDDDEDVTLIVAVDVLVRGRNPPSAKHGLTALTKSKTRI